MATRVPALERAIGVLDLLQGRPAESFTITGLSVELGISKATCHSILACLVAAQLVRREPQTKRYTLGVAALRLASAAASRFEKLPEAGDAARRLARHTGLPCIVSAVEDNEIVPLLVIGGPIIAGSEVMIGDRAPFVAPYGLVFISWAVPAAREEWLNATTGADREAAMRIRSAIESTALRGYAIGLRDTPIDQLSALARRIQQASGPVRVSLALELAALLEQHNYVPAALNPTAGSVDFLAAPIFDDNAAVTLALTLVLSEAQVSETMLREWGALLVTAAERV